MLKLISEKHVYEQVSDLHSGGDCDSNLSRNTGYHDRFFVVFLNLRTDARIVPGLSHGCFLPNPFQFVILSDAL
jgi:hypothetical protein